MNEMQPSAEDLAAVRRLMGEPVNTESKSKVTVLARTAVRGTTGMYDVERRIDTVNGGMYTYCPCPAWRFSKSQPKQCTHSSQADDHWNREGMAWTREEFVRH